MKITKSMIISAMILIVISVGTSMGASDRFAKEDKSLPADPKAVPQTVQTTDHRELKLVWNDEFAGTGLPDPTKWENEVGFLRNNELQYYTKDRTENVRQENGVLVIESRKERWKNPKWKPDSDDWRKAREFAEYTSASIRTRDKASWLYGRIEVRAKLPKGKGIWPAIWMVGDNAKQVGWPACGEIDLMEYIGKEPGNIYSTIHLKGKTRGHISKGSVLKIEAPEDQFYTYILEWTNERMDFFVDDRLIFSFPVEEFRARCGVWPFDKPQNMILNTALGGAWSGEVANDTCPARFEIDFVRVYQ